MSEDKKEEKKQTFQAVNPQTPSEDKLWSPAPLMTRFLGSKEEKSKKD